MGLPVELAEEIEEYLRSIAPREVARAAEDLTLRYRDGADGPALPPSEAHRAAYLAVRLPATFAAVAAALREVHEQLPGFAPASLLDLGAGPGTASWAAAEQWPSLRTIALHERDAAMAALGRRLAAKGFTPALTQAQWRTGSLPAPAPLPEADVVLAGYLFNEFAPAARAAALDQAWAAARQLLVLIEPGTPAGFAVILEARERLLAAGGHVVAPCSHAGKCPLAGGSWCHFSERLDRSARHRQAKGAALGYEDEKYSWLAVAREPFTPLGMRLLSRPAESKVKVELMLCQPDEPLNLALPRADREDFRRAHKVRWGEVWE